MMSIWIERHAVGGSLNLFPDRCVVCCDSCNEKTWVKSATTNPLVGGLGYLIGATQKFLVPAHHGNGCARAVSRSLFIRESLPMLLMGTGSLFSLALAVAFDEVFVFIILIFFWLLIVAVLDYSLERNKNWWIRIHEVPAAGRCGAYEFEFKNDSYALEFAQRNQAVLTKETASRLRLER